VANQEGRRREMAAIEDMKKVGKQPAQWSKQLVSNIHK